MALTFPTTATGATATPSAVTTTSGLFSGPTTTSNTGGSGWFGAGGGGGSTSAYFQTVIISLVALAVLLIISVAFLYYRRRRMRLYSAADWPFHDRTMGGNMFFPGGAPNGRNKESKDIGEKPEMWQVMLDDEKLGASSTDVRSGSSNGSMGISAEEREMQQEEVEKNGSLTRWQPLSIVSLTTHQASVPASTTNDQDGAGTNSGTRPTNMFNRGFSSHAVNRSVDGDTSRTGGNASTTTMAYNSTEATPGADPGLLPIHLTFIIAMPQPPSTRPPPVRSAYDDEDEGEDIPDVQLGTTVIDLDLPAEMTQSGGASSSPTKTSPSYPPAHPHPTSPSSPVNRHTSLGHVLGLTSAQPEQSPAGGATSTALSLRDVLGLPAPVQRTRRERRREREMIGVR